MSEPAAERARPLVWLVDDSPTNRAITERSLGPDYAFEHFHDGSEVVEVLGRGAPQPDVLLLDWVMPGMSGDEVCRFLRAHPETRDLPVILVTASRVETGDVVRGLAVGANDYVARPFAAEELRARVEAVLRTKQLQLAASRERQRLTAVNELGRKLFEARTVDEILGELAKTLTSSVAEGCSVLILPGELPETTVVRHRAEPSGAELAAISTVADPAVYAFDNADDATRQLPPAYHPYVSQFGLRGLAILPMPPRAAVQGLVTVTRDGSSTPFDREDLSLIETCVEYASLALQNVMRLEAERTALAQLHAVLAHAPIGIVVTDRYGIPTLVNPRAKQLVPGIEYASTLAAVSELATWTTLDGAAADPQWVAMPRDAEPRSRQLLMQPLAGGRVRAFALTTVALVRESGIDGSVTTIDDITLDREVTAERERVAHFQEQMLAIVGHDLRSPLSAITMGASALLEGSTKIESVAGRIAKSAHRMATMVDQLLDVTRARLGGGIPILRQEIALDTVVRGVLEEVTVVHPGASFELLAAEPVQGQWDPGRLAQVVSNLVGNAVQYGEHGQPIQVSVSRTEGRAVLVVANAARGDVVSTERLQSMFEPFKRGHDARHHASGLGLGLYIVSEIVRAHEGTIAAETTPVSVRFRVELPFGPSSTARA